MEWKNKQRTLIVCSRGVTHQHRHLINDLIALIPHSKKEAKIDRKSHYEGVRDLCELHSCSSFIYLESRKKYAFVWLGQYPEGPSAKFLLSNVHTSSELRLSGNCIKGSRPVLSFDESFDQESSLQLLKLMFIQAFSTPRFHPKSSPFIDHVLGFSQVQNKIFFRNFEIINQNNQEMLVEIGPRFTLVPIKIFSGMLSEATLYKNLGYVKPRKQTELGKERKRKQKVFNVNPDELSIKDVF